MSCDWLISQFDSLSNLINTQPLGETNCIGCAESLFNFLNDPENDPRSEMPALPTAAIPGARGLGATHFIPVGRNYMAMAGYLSGLPNCSHIFVEATRRTNAPHQFTDRHYFNMIKINGAIYIADANTAMITPDLPMYLRHQDIEPGGTYRYATAIAIAGGPPRPPARRGQGGIGHHHR